MEVHVNSDLEAKLNRVAAERVRDTGRLVQEAVERIHNYNGWFIGELENGMAVADRGECIEPEEIGKLI